MSVSPAELRAALLPLLTLLEAAPFVRVRETLCRQTSVQCRCATIPQLNANLLFEISDLPTEGWLRSVELLLCGDGETARVGHGDEVA
jgi:hypothetical protein